MFLFYEQFQIIRMVAGARFIQARTSGELRRAPCRRLVARVRNDQIRWREASVEGGQLLAMLIDPSIAK